MLLRTPTKVPEGKFKDTMYDAINQRDIFLPIEVVEHIIDLVRDDKQILLSLGGVSKHLLFRTRYFLFSTLQVSDGKKFDELLDIMDVPWSSFTSAVQRIRMEGLFGKWDHSYKTRQNLSRIADNLRKATVLQLKPPNSWVLTWHCIDAAVLGFMSHLHVKHFELFSTAFIMPHHIGYLFNWIPHSMEAFAFYDLRGDRLFGDGSTTLMRRLHFTVLDHRSLKLWLQHWGSLSPPPDVSVETLHIWPHKKEIALEMDNLIPLFSKFLHLSNVFSSSLSMCLIRLTFFDLSSCKNLRTIFIGLETVVFEDLKMVSKTLSTLPSPDSLQDIYVGFKYGEEIEPHLGSSEFVEFLDNLHNMFQNAKKIGILLNPEYLGKDRFEHLSIDELRGSDRLRKLEEGALKFHFVETDVCSSHPGKKWPAWN